VPFVKSSHHICASKNKRSVQLKLILFNIEVRFAGKFIFLIDSFKYFFLNPMLQKTSAISLSHIKYKESSVIARFFTEEFGSQSFVINGIRSSKSKISSSLFQPLTICELVEYHDEKKELHRLKEIRAEYMLRSIPFESGKIAIAIFIAEYLSKVLHDGQPNTLLFSLVKSWVLDLDSEKVAFDAMHIKLVWKTLSPLGITPNDWQDILPAQIRPNDEQLEGLKAFFNWMEDEGNAVQISGAMKQWVLDAMIFYVRTHLEGMGNLQSLNVLRQVFS